MLRYLVISFVLFQITLADSSYGHSPAQFFEVLQGKSSSLIQHGVDTQTQLDSKRAEVGLSGPFLFSRGITAMGRSGEPAKAYLNWYKIDSSGPDSTESASPERASRKTVSILDPFRGDNKTELTLGNAEYLLCPAQVIRTGTPAAIPHGLDYYKAYKVIDSESVNAKVTVGSGDRKQERTVAKPVLVCIAAKHWHHDEHTDATHPDQCYVVYQMNEIKLAEKISTMDQFGLNQFQTESTHLLCVTGKLLDTE